MKTKLLSKSALILAGIALLASCGNHNNEPTESSEEPTEPTVETIPVSAAIGWDYTNEAPNYDGTVVRLEDCVVNATYGANNISIVQYEISVDEAGEEDLNASYAIEVVLAEENTTYDIKDIVSVEGTITSTNGRPQLVDATIEWGTEGQAVCEWQVDEDGKSIPGTGGALWYTQIVEGMERSWFTDAGRSDSGLWTEVNVQIVTVPTITVGQVSQFYVVFPGENPNVNDDNLALVEVNIPALTESQVGAVNEWVGGLEVGDFVKLFAQTWFNGWPQFMLPYASFRFSGVNQHVEVEGLFTNWAEAAAELATLYAPTLPNLSTVEAFSYSVMLDVLTTELPGSLVTINATSGDNALADLFMSLGEDGKYHMDATKLAAFEAAGWYCTPLLQDPDDGTIFLNMYNGVIDDTEKYKSSTATLQLQVTLRETNLQVYIIPLSAEAIVVEEAPLSLQIASGYSVALTKKDGNYDYRSPSVGYEDVYGLTVLLAMVKDPTQNQAELTNWATTICTMAPAITGVTYATTVVPTWSAENGMALAQLTATTASGESVVINIITFVAPYGEGQAYAVDIKITPATPVAISLKDAVITDWAFIMFGDVAEYNDVSAQFGREAYVVSGGVAYVGETDNVETETVALVEEFADYASEYAGATTTEVQAAAWEDDEDGGAAYAVYQVSNGTNAIMVQIASYVSALSDGTPVYVVQILIIVMA